MTIDVPSVTEANEKQLPDELADIIPQVLCYLVTFAVLGRFWLLHHRLFGAITRLDWRLSVLNLVYLAFVGIFPFTSELLSDYGDQSVAVAIYAGGVALVSLLGSAMTEHALRRDLMRDDFAREEARAGLQVGIWITAVFTISIGIAFLDPTVAIASWVLLALARGGITAVAAVTK